MQFRSGFLQNTKHFGCEVISFYKKGIFKLVNVKTVFKACEQLYRFGILASYLDQVSELAEGFPQMNFLGVCWEDGQISSVHNRSGRCGLTSQLQVAQSQQDTWFYHIFQARLSQAAETAHFNKVQFPIGQIKCRRGTCVQKHKQSLSKQYSYGRKS